MMQSNFNRKIIVRVILGYLLALSLTLAIVFLTLTRLNNINETVDELTNNLAVTRAHSQSVVSQLHQVKYYADRYRRFYNQQDLDNFHQKIAHLKTSQKQMVQHNKTQASTKLIQHIQDETAQYEQEFAEITKLIIYQQSLLSTIFIKQELLIENHLSAIRVNVGIVHVADIFFSFGNARNAFELMRLFQSKYLSSNDEKYFVMFKKNYHYARKAFNDLNLALNSLDKNNAISLIAAQANAELKIYYETFLDIHSASIRLKKLSLKLDKHETVVGQTAKLLAQGIEEQYKAHNKLTQDLVLRTQFELLGAVIIAILLNLVLIFTVLRKIITPIFQAMQSEAVELKKAKDKAEVANRVKTEFVANMSHELRTPLNAVIGFSELLSTMVVEPKQKDFISSIKIAGQNLLMLINNVLDLSKIESGKVSLQPTPVNLLIVLDEIEQIFSLNIREKQISLVIYYSTELPELIALDKIRIRQILLNLVGNAIKFTEHGYVKVCVNIKLKNNKVDLMLSVVDTGIGIPFKDQKKVFNSFQQQSNQNAIKYGGTGLGLTITKRLIESMNGTVTLTSNGVKGCQFDVFIPDLDIVALSSKGIYELPQKNKLCFLPANILVVDDVESNRVLMQAFLAKHNLNTYLASDGKEALATINKIKPAVIIMDFRMPVMSGIDVAKKLKEKTESAHIPIIALSAASTEQDRAYALKNGFADFLSKPVNFDLLLQALSLYLKQTPEDKQPDDVEVVCSCFKLENIYQPEQLLLRLQQEIIPSLQQLKKAFILSFYKQLGRDLEQLGKQHKLTELCLAAQNIITLSESFNVKGMNRSIKTSTELINTLIVTLEQKKDE